MVKELVTDKDEKVIRATAETILFKVTEQECFSNENRKLSKRQCLETNHKLA